MNRTVKTIFILILLALFAYWTTSDVKKYKNEQQNKVRQFEYETKKTLDFCLENVVWREMNARISMPETNTVLKLPETRTVLNFKHYTDTLSYVTKTIETMDTTFQVRINKDNWAEHLMIVQFIMKAQNPVNLDKLGKYLIDCLKSNKIEPDTCYIEYLDLKKNTLINHSKNAKPTVCVDSEVYPLDIIKTIGVKAYISVEYPEFWDKDMKNKVMHEVVLAFLTFLILLGIILFWGKIFPDSHKSHIENE